MQSNVTHISSAASSKLQNMRLPTLAPSPPTEIFTGANFAEMRPDSSEESFNVIISRNKYDALTTPLKLMAKLILSFHLKKYISRWSGFRCLVQCFQHLISPSQKQPTIRPSWCSSRTSLKSGRGYSPGRRLLQPTCTLPVCLSHRASECKLRVRCRCHGCEVENSESTDTR